MNNTQMLPYQRGKMKCSVSTEVAMTANDEHLKTAATNCHTENLLRFPGMHFFYVAMVTKKKYPELCF